MKRYSWGKSNIQVIFVVIIITIIATYVLNMLISNRVEEVSRDIAQGSFRKKYESIQKQFDLLQKPLNDAERIVREQSDENTILQNLSMLKVIHLSDSSVVNTWYGVLKAKDKSEGHFYFSNELNDTLSLKRYIKSHSISETSEVYTKIVQNGEGVTLWKQEIYIPTPYGIAFYGYDLDLIRVSRLFWDIDVYALSYAYVFNAQGICLWHPEMEYIGKDVFSFSPLVPSDTLPDKKEQRVVESEYLNLDVINYVRPLSIKGDSYYVAVNFPKSINEQDINSIKKYSFTIYTISVLLLLFVFYYFTRVIRKEYREKELLRVEKAGLALEKERFEKESALLQLQQLKNRVNPHFLFNALNSLFTLIEADKERSKNFTLKLSKLYRYLIKEPKGDSTEVKTELAFIEEYMFLQYTRFGDKLKYGIEVKDEKALQRKIPYLSLQTLIENAIKHNRATKEEPLHIRITVGEDKVVVKNSYQLKEAEQEGSRFGLNYLERIYEYYKVAGFSTYIKEGFYICELPLL